MTDDMGFDLKLPAVGELTLPQWQDWLARYNAVLVERNNRIEKLEAALREIVNERGICGHCGKLASGNGKRAYVICDETVLGFKGPCHWTPQDPKDIASKALEGKDE